MERTQIYLPVSHLRAIQREAKRAGLSVTELVRRIVAEHVEGRRGVDAVKKEQVLSFIALGRSRAGGTTSEHHDDALDEAFRAGDLR
jgi:hypothetical protein